MPFGPCNFRLCLYVGRRTDIITLSEGFKLSGPGCSVFACLMLTETGTRIVQSDKYNPSVFVYSEVFDVKAKRSITISSCYTSAICFVRVVCASG